MANRLDPQKVQQAFVALGVFPNDIEALRTIPFPAAQARLAALKALARKNFRKLSLELHPDRTGNDPIKTEQFKVISAVRDELERIEVQAPAQAPKPVPISPIAANPFTHQQGHFHVVRGVTIMMDASGAGYRTVPIRFVIRR